MHTTKVVVTKQNGSLVLPGVGDPLSEGIRGRVRSFIEEILNEELDAVLGAGRYERTGGRCGHRNGSKSRELTTSFGKTRFERPRAVLFEKGKAVEFVSTVVERYRRRSREVDAALLGMYFGGVTLPLLPIFFSISPPGRVTMKRGLSPISSFVL
jgi:transposase-like protein